MNRLLFKGFASLIPPKTLIKLWHPQNSHNNVILLDFCQIKDAEQFDVGEIEHTDENIKKPMLELGCYVGQVPLVCPFLALSQISHALCLLLVHTHNSQIMSVFHLCLNWIPSKICSQSEHRDHRTVSNHGTTWHISQLGKNLTWPFQLGCRWCCQF